MTHLPSDWKESQASTITCSISSLRLETSPSSALSTLYASLDFRSILCTRSNTPSITQRIAKITSTLELDLSQLLATVLSSPSSDTPTSPRSTRESLTSLLRTYTALNLVPAAEEIFRTTVVRPFVIKTIHRDVLSSVQSPAVPVTPAAAVTNPFFAGDSLAPAINLQEDRSTPSFYAVEPVGLGKGEGKSEAEPLPLAVLYNQILTFISRECGLMLDVAERTTFAPPTAPLAVAAIGKSAPVEEAKQRAGFELLANVVWEEVANRLMGELGHVIFAAGRPTVFHQVSQTPSRDGAGVR